MPIGPTNSEATSEEVLESLWLNLTNSHPLWLEGCHFSPTAIKALVEVSCKLGFVAGVRRGRADVRLHDQLRRIRRTNYESYLLMYLGKDLDGQEETPGEDLGLARGA